MKNNRRRAVKGLVVGALLSTGLGYARVVQAHGSAIEVTPNAVAINATFDDGTPMADAQVVVFSPNDPKTPWKKGQTDAAGQYLFAPASDMPGAWEVVVRTAGHGGTTTFAVDASGTSVVAPSAAATTAAMPKWLSMAAVVWGFVGTALFFSRRTPPADKTTTALPSSGTTAVQVPVGSSVGNSAGGQH